MGGGLRSALLTLGSLTIAASFAGCAWFSQLTSSTEQPAPVASQPAPEPTTAAPAPTTSTPVTAAPAAASEVVKSVPHSNGFTEVAELTDVRFRSGQVGIARGDQKSLDKVVRWMKQNPGAVVMIEGHTDDVGSREENMVVGEKRAASVMRYLVARGLEPARISATSVGSERPTCFEKTDSCRAQNRRARFLIKQP